MTRSKTATGIFSLAILLAGTGVGVYLLNQNQDIRNFAQEGPQCLVNAATCSWDASQYAASYEYKIIETTSGLIVKEGTTTQTSVVFTPTLGVQHRCQVIPLAVCGARGATQSAQQTCVLPSPSASVTATASASKTPTPKRTATASASLTPKPSAMQPTPTPPAQLPKAGTTTTAAALIASGITLALLGTALLVLF